MVNNNILLSGIIILITIHRIILYSFFISHTTTEETNNYIIGIHPQSVVLQTDSLTRSCLTCNSNVIVGDN